MEWIRQACRSVDKLFRNFSYYLLPVAIALFSIYFLVFLPSIYDTRGETSLPFRVIEATSDDYTPASARAALQGQADVLTATTQLSERPFWLAVRLPQASRTKDTFLDFPSRHTQALSCWNAETLALLGQTDRASFSGAVQPVRAGYAFSVDRISDVREMLCRVVSSGPARLSFSIWPRDQLANSSRAFAHGIGLLEGGLLTLAIFTIVTALINRESRYVLFAVWLIGNLRLGALSMGWDTQWLSRVIDNDWMPVIRMLTMAFYYVVTYTLFTQFFERELRVIGYRWLMRAVQMMGIVLLVLAVTLPYSMFLPALWAVTGFGAASLVFFLVRILVITRSRIAWWYSATLVFTLFATFSEVIAAAFDFKALLESFNSVTAALGASLMAGFAFAEQMREEKHERMQAQAELDRTYQVTPVGLFTLDPDGSFVRVNPALRQQLGLEQDSLPAKPWADYFAPGAWDALQGLAAHPQGGELEVSGVAPADDPDGAGTGADPRWYLVRAAHAGDRIEGSLQDITERVKYTERLQYLANNDSLTGVLNRRGVEEILNSAIINFSDDHPLSIGYLDLDRFKLINDLYGHQAGDEVLKQVCARVDNVLEPGHFLGRVGGDEFIVIFHDTDTARANELCLRIVKDICTRPYQLRNRAFQVKISIGLVEATAGMDAKDLISAADRACREAKRGAHGHVVVYKKYAREFLDRAEELRLIEELGSTFSPVGFFLEMQPIMALKDPGNSLNFEVLLRMLDSHGERLPPTKIVAAAEANGNIAELDKWVLSTTLQWLRTNVTRLLRTKFVCVNVSGASLNDEAFIEDVFALLERYQDVAPMLCIEITESVALHDLENSRRFIERLRQWGVRIALDDFGAGYTSFSYLKDLSADALKIDGSFVRGMHRHPANLAIVEAIVELAHNLGMRSIAEWAEDFETVEALAEMGVDYVQGFIVAEPQSPAALLDAESCLSFVTDYRLLRFFQERERGGEMTTSMSDYH